MTPYGELDLQTSPDLRSALSKASEANVPVVVDLSLVSFIDASAVGVFTAAQRRLATTGRSMVIVGASVQVMRVLRLTGLLDFLHVQPATTPGHPGSA